MAKNDAILIDGILDDRVAERLPSDRRGGELKVSGTFFDELCLIMIGFDSLENGQNLLMLRDKMLYRTVLI